MKKNIIIYGVYFFTLFCVAHQASALVLGLENISQSSFKFPIFPQNKKLVIGLITNQTGIDQHYQRSVDVLLKKNICTIQYIFVPEHGLTGIDAERDVFDGKDKQTGIPIISLYKNGTGKMISAEQLAQLDGLFFDIQDSGMRHYTYISTLLQTMKVAAEARKFFVVLDRPNPLGGLIEGPIVTSDLISFISIAPIPLRHGMTIGEVALYFNKHVMEKSVALHIIPMVNYTRSSKEVPELLKPLSPNIKTKQSCMGYSFLGLLGEVEPFDVGVGTDMAFRCIALPASMNVKSSVWDELKNLLQSYGIASCAYTHKSKKTKKETVGLQLNFDTIDTLRAFELFIDILLLFKRNGIIFSFSAAFNRAVGSAKVKDVIMGVRDKKTFFNEIRKDLERFKKRSGSILLYHPLTTV